MSERKARAARKAAVLEWGKSWMDEMAQFDGVPATKTVEDMWAPSVEPPSVMFYAETPTPIGLNGMPREPWLESKLHGQRGNGVITDIDRERGIMTVSRVDAAMVQLANQIARIGGNAQVKMMPEQSYRDMCEKAGAPVKAVFYRGVAILAETDKQFAWAVSEIDWSTTDD